MKVKLHLIMILTSMLWSSVFAQQLTREDFRKNEWQMKAEYYKNLQERQDPHLALDQTDFDVKYWDLRIDLTDIAGETIEGQVIMTSEATVDGISSIDYNLHSSMVVDSVKIAGLPAAFTRPSGLLRITLDRAYNTSELITTEAFYHGHPPGGGLGSFTWDTHNGQPIISTLSEPEGAREWWPCKDTPHDKADSADVRYTVTSSLTATSNGELISDIDNGDGTRTFHWHISYPITTYLISLAASNYQSFTDWYISLAGDSMPVTSYVYPEHFSQAEEDLSIVPGAIAIYAGLFGEYPFLEEKYGHSIFPWGGAMEHQCNTSYGEILINGFHSYDWIAVHELAHMWFGDKITCDTWPDIWMNEGFASYCEALYYEHFQGPTGYINYMRNSNGVYDPSGPIYDPDQLFDGNTVYNKGSWALHILRGVMGDSAFFEGMRGYANHPDHIYGTIQTREFQHIMEGYYGDSLSWFFDQWVWGMNRPIYRYSWLDESIGNGEYEVFLHISQIQGSPAPNVFTMPIRVYPRINGIDTVITVWNDSRVGDYRFVVIGNPGTMDFDKNYWILREVQLEAYRMNIVTTGLPDGRQDSVYNEQVEARGGILPYNFTIVSGQLPQGLSLSASTGMIAGEPTEFGAFNFTVRCTDSSNPQITDDQSFLIFITETAGCEYTPGDANGNEVFNGIDVTYSVSYLKGLGEAPVDICDCPPHGIIFSAADANGNCQFNGIDVTYGVSYLKGLGPAPLGCSDCLPIGP
jgi:hypothetical protein